MLSALPPTADIARTFANGRKVPIGDVITACRDGCHRYRISGRETHRIPHSSLRLMCPFASQFASQNVIRSSHGRWTRTGGQSLSGNSLESNPGFASVGALIRHSACPHVEHPVSPCVTFGASGALSPCRRSARSGHCACGSKRRKRPPSEAA